VARNAGLTSAQIRARALHEAMEEVRQTLGKIIDVWEQGVAEWLDEKNGDALMSFISQYESEWVTRYRAIPIELQAAKEGKVAYTMAHRLRMNELAGLASNIDASINKLNDVQEGIKKPTLATAKLEFASFFATLIPEVMPKKKKKSKATPKATPVKH